MSKGISKILGVIFALFLSPFLFANMRTDEDGLKDIAKPYVGTYECTQLMLGGEDCLEKFDYFRIELTGDGRFIVRIKDKKGKKHGGEAAYEYDTQSKRFFLVQKTWIGIKKIPFEIDGGELFLFTRFGPKILSLKLERG